MPDRTPLQIRRTRRKHQGFHEDLGDGVRLTMMRIPAGTFVMGAPETEEESRDNERPQHEVSLAEFCLGRYPVTQAQWRVVAGYEQQVERELDPELSRFKGDRRPVERVSWDDAQEFCRRLSVKSGREYRLPSEAEWEYACRAGTMTPFFFGETLTPELASYDCSYTYGDRGVKGEWQRETKPVGYYEVANTWGLSDMHGNVFEWCEDDWHNSYEGAPTDGSAWLESGNENSTKVRRGGSWRLSPGDCRSAYRIGNSRAFRYHGLGFRVACAAPRLS
jgi:formylglycine-generating enzyme required for sulfatase activity